MSRFKTELCNNLIELGICKYGDRCHYAHGAHELRQVSRRHPKYRTERCKNYELTGKCPFGPRCSYVHPKPDYELMIEQLSNYVQHTKAPKPDSEDEDDTISLLTRTATSTSLNSHCGSSIGDSNRFLTGDEANKENHFIIQNPIGSSLSLNQKEFEHDFDFVKENQRLTLIDYPITLNQRDNSVLQPLTLKNPNVEQLTPKAIRPIQPRVAMRAISKNQSQQDSQHSNLQSSSPFSHASSNPFGISNPLSDYFNSANHTTGNHLVSNKQFYTRF